MVNLPPITLTTDFGFHDTYIGEMKGVILGIQPQATIIDLCHQIQPQAIHQAAFLLGSCYKYFPRGTIHVIVVDSGVASSGKVVILSTPDAVFVAPDNGVLTYILRDGYPGDSAESNAASLVTLPVTYSAHQLTNSQYWIDPVSPTFQGRDIMAPVAAHLTAGINPRHFGKPLTSMIVSSVETPKWHGNILMGTVVHIDHYGNLITNIRTDLIPECPFEICIQDRRIQNLSSTYAETDNLLAIKGSYGYLEIALRNGNLAANLSILIGEPIRINRLSKAHLSIKGSK